MPGSEKRTPFLRPGPRTELDPDLVLDVVTQTAERLTDPLLLRVPHPQETDPAIELVEDERRTTITLMQLVGKFERAAVPEDHDAIAEAVTEWLDLRPVSDRTALDRGIATLGWSNRQSRIKWRVVVPRPSGVTVDWVPTVHTSSDLVHRVRDAAMERARGLTVTPLSTGETAGEVTVWVYLVNPALSTAVLSQPHLLSNSGGVADLHAVFTPGRPVAVAPRVAAARLTEESSEPHKMLPLAELDTIGWM